MPTACVATRRKGDVSEAESRATVLARWSEGIELPPDIADIVSDLRTVL
jgi:hypothetical protein